MTPINVLDGQSLKQLPKKRVIPLGEHDKLRHAKSQASKKMPKKKLNLQTINRSVTKGTTVGIKAKIEVLYPQEIAEYMRPNLYPTQQRKA